MTVAVPSRGQSAVGPSPLTAAAAAALRTRRPGESLPVEKLPPPVSAGTPLAELTSCALMGTRLPAALRSLLLALILMVVAYLVLIELGKHWFYRSYREPTTAAARGPSPPAAVACTAAPPV